MQYKSSIPNIVLEAGLPTRFRYWSGNSGARYLFTRTDLTAIDHFDEAVVILVRFGRIIWAGFPPGRAPSCAQLTALARRDGTEIYIHLLARTDEQRDRIVDDLTAMFDIRQTEPDGLARIIEFPVAA